ncbi:MAG: hypothetical protein MRY64_00820, partial [Hyphomonadaceae bacterium]|nr:hypothetical protein [Hyphomonadaceae bacterium]
MSETDCKSPGLGKTSLLVALPLVAMALAMGMSLIFLTASITAARLHGKAESKAQAERVAHLLAPDLAEGHDAGIQNTLSAFSPAYLEIRRDGNTAYSSASERREEIRHSVPIVHDGVRIGELRTTALADGKIIMPTWGVGGLFILSISLAFALSYYFAGRITYAVNAVRQ